MLRSIAVSPTYNILLRVSLLLESTHPFNHLLDKMLTRQASIDCFLAIASLCSASQGANQASCLSSSYLVLNLPPRVRLGSSSFGYPQALLMNHLLPSLYGFKREKSASPHFYGKEKRAPPVQRTLHSQGSSSVCSQTSFFSFSCDLGQTSRSWQNCLIFLLINPEGNSNVSRIRDTHTSFQHP